jgi:signal transduction histidine kinase
LTLIYTPLNRLIKNLPPDDSNYSTLKRIYKQTQRMKDLINLVLDVRKMEVGESKFIFDKYPLNQWIQETGQDFMDEGNEKHIQLSFQLDPHITEVVYDQDKLMIVVSNLLINALKHSPEHSTIRVSTQLFPSEQYVKISVSD